MRWRSDIDAGVQLCLHCRKLHPLERQRCDRCGSHLFQRKPHAVIKTFSLALSALLLLIPANLLPMMVVHSLVGNDAGTIMDGVIYFLEHGEAWIGIVIFIASVFVPFFKVTTLFYLLFIVYFRLRDKAHGGLRLYRIIHFIGKWSMLDIFVVALMVGVVQFKNLATIVTGPAAVAFMLAVVATMFATEAFDTRLMFDHETQRSTHG